MIEILQGKSLAIGLLWFLCCHLVILQKGQIARNVLRSGPGPSKNVALEGQQNLGILYIHSLHSLMILGRINCFWYPTTPNSSHPWKPLFYIYIWAPKTWTNQFPSSCWGENTTAISWKTASTCSFRPRKRLNMGGPCKGAILKGTFGKLMIKHWPHLGSWIQKDHTSKWLRSRILVFFSLDMAMAIHKLHKATCRACEVLYIAPRAEKNNTQEPLELRYILGCYMFLYINRNYICTVVLLGSTYH